MSASPVAAICSCAATAGWAPNSWHGGDFERGPDLLELGPHVAGALRESRWGSTLLRRAKPGIGVPQWAPEVGTAVQLALRHAAANNMQYAHLPHLLTGICADDRNRAVMFLNEMGTDPQKVLVACQDAAVKVAGTPTAAAAAMLEKTGPLQSSARWSLLAVVRRADLRGWPRGAKPIVAAVSTEAERIAVRGGADQINQAHYLAALSALHHQLDYRAQTLREKWAPHNDAAVLLRQHGIDVRHIVLHAYATNTIEPTTFWPHPRRRQAPARLPFERATAEVIQHALLHAEYLGHTYVGTSHILLSLLIDQDGTASRLLRGLGVDTDELARDVSARLRVNSSP